MNELFFHFQANLTPIETSEKNNCSMHMTLSEQDKDRIIEMAWEDRTTFDAIEFQFGLKEQEVIELMRKEMKPTSFRMWRKRVQGRATKHLKQRSFAEGRHKCSRQRQISGNKISKR